MNEINIKKQHQEWSNISKDELEFALNKSPGMDKISNFWASSLSKGHEKLALLLIQKTTGLSLTASTEGMQKRLLWV